MILTCIMGSSYQHCKVFVEQYNRMSFIDIYNSLKYLYIVNYSAKTDSQCCFLLYGFTSIYMLFLIQYIVLKTKNINKNHIELHFIHQKCYYTSKPNVIIHYPNLSMLYMHLFPQR